MTRPKTVHKLVRRTGSKWTAETWCGTNPRNAKVAIADYLHDRPAVTCKACLRAMAQLETANR